MISFLMFSSDDFDDEMWTFDEECKMKPKYFIILIITIS